MVARREQHSRGNLGGEALGAVEGSTLADAVVMASAALRGGGIVYTSNLDDLKQLQRHIPTVLILPASPCRDGARSGGGKYKWHGDRNDRGAPFGGRELRASGYGLRATD